MAKEINISCNLLTNQLVCELLEQTMDVLLKVRTRTGEHRFKEDIYTHTKRWNNELRPFRSLKRRVANIFQKRNLLFDDSKGISTQTIVNDVEREDERSKPNSTKRGSIHSDWSDLLPVNEEAEYKKICRNRSEPNIIGVATTSAASTTETTKKPSVPPVKKTVKNIVLVSYMPKSTDWGHWWIRSPYTTSTIASPPAVQPSQQEKEEEGELVYEPHSPYYFHVHPPKFYKDE